MGLKQEPFVVPQSVSVVDPYDFLNDQRIIPLTGGPQTVMEKLIMNLK
ncbi:hypothetical protein [Chengkuizengella axinellae]|uniref:Uncharacterized protein n=1 Tax=Chengkuizengella axinellae TaxID=3064388 RepID=A0ABT9IXF0_9BACL|nr:hypothetical protein [Chengkuizengella sp. 2205SS18-9]MDP5274021.1 hypothetical protein [Chengkuizengella sp. 2205SS18-9]